MTTPPWTPDDDPLAGLTRSLTHAGQRAGLASTPAEIHDVLPYDPRGLRRIATDLLGARPTAHDRRLLVAVDQAEELFTRTGPAERAHVAALLRDAACGPAQPVLTPLTLARYGDLGGVQGALVRHADAALAAAGATGLTEQEVLAGLVRLVTIDDAGRWARRQVTVASRRVLPPAMRRAR